MLGILCGFEPEAKVARQLSPLVACSGAREDVARARAEELVKKGATTLLSFGVAGGLSPGLTPDSLVVGDRVTSDDGRSWRTDERLLSILLKAVPQARRGGVYGSKTLIATPADKKRLFDRTGCLIVDMESQVLAEVASRHPVRFGVLRGVSDTVEEKFPTALLSGLKPDGKVNGAVIALHLLKEPAQVPALMQLFKNTDRALKNLKTALPAVSALISQF